MAVRIHIRELVMYGLPAAGTEAIAEQVQRALVSQLAKGSTFTGSLTKDRVDGGAFICESSSPRDLAAGIASGVSKALLP